MTLLTIIQSALGVFIALLYCLRKMTHRWQLWIPLVAFLFPPTIHILAQWKRLATPSVLDWVVRIVIAGSAALICIGCGNLGVVDNQVTRAFKAQAMILFSEHALAVRDTSVLASNGETFLIPYFGRSPFVIASIAILYGALFFQRPYRMMAALAVIGFLAGMVMDFTIFAATIDATVNQGNFNTVKFTEAYFTGAAYISIALFWLTFALAAWQGHRAASSLTPIPDPTSTRSTT